MRFVFVGKAKDISLKEIWLQCYYGRKIELLEAVDFGRN